VDALHGGFEPEKYVDQYRANLLRIIDAKSKGKKADLPSGKPEWGDGKVLDLMQKLEASLREGRAAKKNGAAKSKNGAPRTKAATRKRRSA
jgi:DNA end-binding protein Ku